MAGYPYYSPPPPSPPCNTTTPTLQPPHPPPTACACNKTSPTLPPPASPSPPPPPSTRYSPPLHSPLPPSHPSPASPPPPPPPPPFYYSPPPLPPSSSEYSPPPPSQSPPKPSKASPPPLLQPTTPPPAPSPYYSPQTPLHPPLAPDSPLCHCVCPSPWATPPNYYPSIAPSPQFLSPSNGHRTVVLTTFVSLGGVFFLAFITIGLLSMAIKKKIPSIPASTSVNNIVIDIDRDQQQVPPDQGADPFLKGETLQQTRPTKPPSNQSMTDKTRSGPKVDQQSYEDVKKSDGEVVDQESIRDDSNKKLHKSLSDQGVTNNIDAPQDAENESNECNRKALSEQSEPGNADAAQDVGQGSNAVQEESNNSKARLRPPKKNPLNGRKGKKGKKKPSKLGQTVKAICLRGYSQDDDDNEEEEEEEEYESHENEEEKDERNRKPFGNQSETENTTIAQDDQQESSTVEEKSNVSEERLHPDDKNPSSSHKGKKLDQAVNAANNDHLDAAVQPQEDDKNEAEPQVDDEELKSSGSNKDSCGKEALVQHHQKRHTSAPGRQESPSLGKMFSTTIGVDPSVVSKSLADDIEKQENYDDPINESDDPSMECESSADDNAKREESKSFGSKKVLHLHKRQISAQRRKEAPDDVGQNLTAQFGDDEGEDSKSLADDYEKEENEDPSMECDDPNTKCELLVHDDAKEEKSDSFGSKKDSRLHKRQISVRGRRDPRNDGQIWTNPHGGDPGTYFKAFADDDEKEEKEDQGMEYDDPSVVFGSLVDDGAKEEVFHLHKRQTGAGGRKKPPKPGQILTATTGSDPGVVLKSVTTQVLKSVAINDDHDAEVQPQEDDKDEAEPQVDDEELKSSGSNKDSCGKEALVWHRQKCHTSAPGKQESPSLGKKFSTTIGVDPSVVSKSLADVDEKEEKEDQGMEYDDPSMDFVSLVDDGDKEEGFSLHKRQTGAGRRKEPPNRGQILTATTGSDPGVGLKSIATQLWASNTGESMTVRNDDDSYGKLESHDDDDGEGDLSVTATNEGDPNAGLEFDEEDEELESECSNKGLGLHKPHALSLGETEPSTDNQSVFVTGDDDPNESSKVARRGKPLSRPRTAGVRGKRKT